MSARIVIAENKLPETFLQACRILQKVRHYRKRFEENHDASTKRIMKQWEERADIFLESLQIEPDPEFVKPETND